MPTTLNRAARERLIDEDIDWLLKQPRTLERDHVEMILRWARRLSNAEIEAAEKHETIPSS